MASAAPADARIAVLQAGRAFAALAVTVFHAALATEAFVGPLPGWLRHAASFGYLGVDFFFVLSGFIIFYTSAGRSAEPGWRRRFAESRLTRIFVPYLPVGLAMAAFYTLFPQVGAAGRGWSWFASVTLLPADSHPALLVAWTLQHELVFYALALIVLKLPRPLLLIPAWAGAILAWAVAAGVPHGPPSQDAAAVLLHPINLEFLFGMAAASSVLTGRLDRPLLLCLLGAAFVVLFFATGGNKSYSFVFGLGLAFWIPVLVRGEWQGRVRVSAWLILLGEASYALYLVHNPVISATTRVVGFASSHWAPGLAAALAASVAAALIFHFAYERPAIRRVRTLLSSRRRPAAS